MNIRIFTGEKEFLAAGVEFVEQVCLIDSQTINIALSGGTTPKKLYKALAGSPRVPFEKIEFWQVDERYVSSESSDSNAKLIKETLIQPAPKKPKAFHFFDTSLPRDESLKKYEEELSHLEDGFDLVILGIGSDGHTASLFPKSRALKEEKRSVAHTTTDHFPEKDRLTLTFPPILKSKKILVLLKGEEKAKILSQLSNPKKPVENFPAKKLLEHASLRVFFCNE